MLTLFFFFAQSRYINNKTIWCFPAAARLSEVGKLEAPKIQGKYDTGQLFLHRIFGYRGVILFPWQAQVYDRDVANGSSAALTGGTPPATPITTTPSKHLVEEEEEPNNRVSTGSSEVKGKTNTFYQVLIDSRDCPFIVSFFVVAKKKNIEFLRFLRWPGSVLKRKRSHFWEIKNRIVAFMQYPVWIMLPTKILCHIRRAKRIRYTMNCLISF